MNQTPKVNPILSTEATTHQRELKGEWPTTPTSEYTAKGLRSNRLEAILPSEFEKPENKNRFKPTKASPPRFLNVAQNVI